MVALLSRVLLVLRCLVQERRQARGGRDLIATIPMSAECKAAHALAKPIDLPALAWSDYSANPFMSFCD